MTNLYEEHEDVSQELEDARQLINRYAGLTKELLAEGRDKQDYYGAGGVCIILGKVGSRGTTTKDQDVCRGTTTKDHDVPSSITTKGTKAGGRGKQNEYGAGAGASTWMSTEPGAWA